MGDSLERRAAPVLDHIRNNNGVAARLFLLRPGSPQLLSAATTWSAISTSFAKSAATAVPHGHIGDDIAPQMLGRARELEPQGSVILPITTISVPEFLQMAADLRRIGIEQIAENRAFQAEIFHLTRGDEAALRTTRSGDASPPSGSGSTGASLNHAI